MALNYIKCLKSQPTLQLVRHLRPFVARHALLSTDNKDSNEVQVFESKIDKHMNEKVLNRTTHTGQSFAADDYRLVRFIGKEKEINPRFAIDLIAEVPPIGAKDRWASCDGGGGPLGHPKVFINLDDPGEYGTCGYCGLRFYKHDTHSHH